MVKGFFKFILYSLKPLSKTADVWDVKDLIQAVFIALGWSGGGGWTLTINHNIAIWILAGVPVMLFLIAGVKLWLDLERIKAKPKPFIVFSSPFTDKKPLWIMNKVNREIASSQDAYLAYVPIKNDPVGSERLSEADATNVIAEIKYCDNHNLLVEFYGRWEESKQPIDVGDTEPLNNMRRINLLANGELHNLHVAVKYLNDKDCFAFTNESLRGDDIRKEEYRLKAKMIRVEITLKGTGMHDETRTYILHNEGKGKSINLQEVDVSS